LFYFNLQVLLRQTCLQLIQLYILLQATFLSLKIICSNYKSQ